MEHIKAKDLNYIDELLEKFVGCSDESGVLCDYEGELVRRQNTEELELDQLYAQLPAKFSPMYERLVLFKRQRINPKEPWVPWFDVT